MTEREWLSSTDPKYMLSWAMAQGQKGCDCGCRLSDRKMRLFACTCARVVWHNLDHDSRSSVEIAELYADDMATADALSRAYIGGVTYCLGERADWCASEAAAIASCSEVAKAHLLHCIIGNPYRLAREQANDPLGSHHDWYVNVCGGCRVCDNAGYGPPSDDGREPCPACRTPITPHPSYRAALAMAEEAYVSRNFDSLPIIADALEEAGCTGIALEHLRSPRPHARGCWVIDLLLEKE